ncbi:MAG: trimethylamine methyltransferase family protein [Chloroflexota bacterium]
MSRTRKRRRGTAVKSAPKTPYLSTPKGQMRNPWPAYEIASEAQIEEIHNASMHILENTGMRFLDDEAMDLWQKAGAKVDMVNSHVWPDRGLLMELVGKAPSGFNFRARNPQNSRYIGGNAINCFANAGMVFTTDLRRGRRPGTKEDYLILAKLTQMTNGIDIGPLQSVVMHDVPVHEKHLENYYVGTVYSDKPMLGVSHGRIIVGDVIDMAKIIHGQDLKPEEGAVTGGIINVNSPLVYDDRMLGGMITFAKHGQFTVVTPFILAGAMSPVTIAAALAQQNAEALAGIALLQLVNPGSPVIYGGFTTNVDMKSGAPAFGTPEGAWALFIGAQLARKYDVPYRGSGALNMANEPDAQAASESMWSLWPCILSHTNYIAHTTGWLEGGLTVSLEKFVMDAENLAMMQHFLKGPEFTEDAFALDYIDEVGPAGHHFGTEHTQRRYADAFYPPFLADRRNFGTWQEAGSEDIVQRAHKLWQLIVKEYQKPAMDTAVHEALQEYIAKRAKELENVELYD